MRWGAFRGLSGSSELVALPDDAALDTYFANLSVRHFLGEGWTLDLQLPVGLVEFYGGAGKGTGRVSGLGDLQGGVRYDFSALWGAGGYRPSLTLRLGMGLPSGTQANINTGPGVPPNLLATGYAAFSGQAQLSATQFVSPNVALQAWLSTSGPMSRTARGLRPPSQLGYGVGALWRPDAALAVSARVAGTHLGQADEEVEGTVLNSGGNFLAAELDVIWFASKRVAVSAGGRLPWLNRVNGQQIVETFSLTIGAVLTFGVEDDKEGHDDEEGHDHGGHDHGGHTHATPPRAAPGGSADLSDLAEGGQTFTASTAWVPGKITVIDYWATWCGPCEVLTQKLTELASRHPRLAIRRVEVPDFDAPVALEHLPGVSALPTVWIMGPKGAKTVLAGQPVSVIFEAVRAQLLELEAAK